MWIPLSLDLSTCNGREGTNPSYLRQQVWVGQAMGVATGMGGTSNGCGMAQIICGCGYNLRQKLVVIDRTRLGVDRGITLSLNLVSHSRGCSVH